jgi:hypothetical protein
MTEHSGVGGDGIGARRRATLLLNLRRLQREQDGSKCERQHDDDSRV